MVVRRPHAASVIGPLYKQADYHHTANTLPTIAAVALTDVSNLEYFFFNSTLCVWLRPLFGHLSSQDLNFK